MTERETADEIRRIIVSSLDLEDLAPADIGGDTPLFGEGLGLDSIDALELGMAVKKRFGVTFSKDHEENRRVFRCVDSLTAFVRAHSEEQT